MFSMELDTGGGGGHSNLLITNIGGGVHIHIFVALLIYF